MTNIFTNFFSRTLMLAFVINVLCLSAIAQNFNVDGIYYSVISGTTNCKVVSKTGKYTGDVTIPSTVTYSGTTYNVTAISYNAFYQCTGLTSIVIPEGVQVIESYSYSNNSNYYGAFSKCSALSSVTLPKSLTQIGDYAFYQCSALTSITIPGVNLIGCYAFSQCSALEELIIEEGVTFIGTGGHNDKGNYFSYCTSLKKVTFPQSLQIIGSWAFAFCSSLEYISIPDNVEMIETGAFHSCVNLTDIYLEGETPPVINPMAFGDNPCMLPNANTVVYGPAVNDNTINDPNNTLQTFNECHNWMYPDEDKTPVREVDCETSSFSISGTDGENYYGTFYSDRPIRLPEGVTGHIATGVENGVLIVDGIYQAGDIVPEGVAIVLSGAQGNHTYECLPFADSEGLTRPTVNLLYGVDKETNIPDEDGFKFYKLSYSDETRTKLGFYYAAAGGRGGFTNPAHRAYLKIPVTQASNVKGFAFKDSFATGIENIGMDLSKEETIYTLQGIRVAHPLQQGIYIVNGKKLIVK